MVRRAARATAYFSSARSVGVVFRVSSTMMCPPRPRRTDGASVAMPDSRWRKLSAVRSPTSSVRADADDFRHDVSGMAGRAVAATGDLASGSSGRNHSNATSRPATTQSAFTRNPPRASRGHRLGRVRRDVAGVDILVHGPADDVLVVARIKRRQPRDAGLARRLPSASYPTTRSLALACGRLELRTRSAARRSASTCGISAAGLRPP